MAVTGKSASSSETIAGAGADDLILTGGRSASMTGDRLLVPGLAPAFPESDPVLGLGTIATPGLGDDLLLQVGFQVTGQSAGEEV